MLVLMPRLVSSRTIFSYFGRFHILDGKYLPHVNIKGDYSFYWKWKSLLEIEVTEMIKALRGFC